MPTFHFKGKPFLKNYHHAVKFHKLEPKKDKSVTKGVPSLDDNLIIHGDNLKALKALLPTHAGKVNCIYIDPPYNTGNENWVYNDNVASPMIQQWLGVVVAKDDLTKHDKWCCMMYPRLTLLREFLTDTGVIFISIDDNEVHNLRAIMDEIIGEENFISSFSIKANPRGRQSNENVALVNEYLLCYAKNEKLLELNGLPMTEEDIEDYDNEEDDGRKWREMGLRQRGSASLREDRPDMFFPIFVNPDNGKISLEPTAKHTIKIIPKKSDGREGRWSWGKKKVRGEIDRVYGREVSGRDEFDIFYRDYLERDGEQKTVKVKSMWLDKEVNTELGGKLLKLILGKKTLEYPKPIGLIKRILQLATTTNSLVLDSFAGSGTTAHAVLDLNKEDGGNRKFILVELEDYADTITAERVRRVIKGVPNAKDENLKKGLGGTFSYYELGEAIEVDNLLEGKKLPSYEDLAKYAFFTSTGENIDTKKIDEKKFYIGSSNTFEVYLIYAPDKKKLKELSLNLDFAQSIHKKHPNKAKLVFAPCCFVEEHHLKEYGVHFAQLPFEIYRIAE